MTLLEELFPGLLNFPNQEFIPKWNEPESPWTIFQTDGFGILDQMEQYLGEQGIFVRPSAKIGDYVTIEGPSIIGPNAEIRPSSFLRKGSWICEGAVVGHSSEVKNSILLPNSKAPHFNYVGDSILGLDVNLGAGTKLSNVRNDRRTVPVMNRKGERFDSGLTKLGAIIGDKSQLGCNVVTNPGSIIAPCMMINPKQTVSGWFD